MADTTLFLNGKSTDNIWLMEDGSEPYVVGMRLDCGDAGVVYMTREQARHLGESLLKSKPSIAGGIKRYSDSEDWGMAEAENGEYVTHADHLTTLASKEEEIKRLKEENEFWQRELNNFRRNARHAAEEMAKESVERLKGLLREAHVHINEHASPQCYRGSDDGCQCGVDDLKARMGREMWKS